MPKTSTGNKRASSASAKKSGLKKRFDLTNRKVQFFVVIAIVAVLGGGYLTVKSFASTFLVGWQGTAIISGQYNTDKPLCPGQNGTESGKNNVTTFDVACPAGPFTTVTSVSHQTPRITVFSPGFYEACTSIKGAGKISIVVLQPWPQDYSQQQESRVNYVLNNNGQYNKYCTKSIYARQGSAQNNVIYMQVSIQRDVNAPVLLKMLNMEIYKSTNQTPTPTAPAPPAK